MNKDLPLSVSVIVTKRDGQPVIELRRLIKNTELIKLVLSCAWHDRPLIIMPSFKNKIEGVSSMLDKGIIYKEGTEYKFTF
jgi:hypothetical protein